MPRPEMKFGRRVRLALSQWWASNSYELAWMAVLIGGTACAAYMMRG